MIKRTAAVFGWLVAGHLVLGGLYWALLQVPEANVLMLATSLLIVLGMLWWLGVVEGAGLTAWDEGLGRTGIGRAARRAWLVIVPLVVFGLVWMLTANFYSWLARYGSQIDAWIILKTGWTKTAALFAAIRVLIGIVRWVIGLSLALALFSAALRDGLRGLMSVAWLRRAFGWRQVIVVLAALAVGFWLPWKYVNWRPEGLTLGTWMEPAFASAKLAVMFLWANVAWTVVLRAVGHERVHRDVREGTTASA